MLKNAILAATTSLALLSAANAEAKVLTLTWSNSASVLDVFRIDDSSAVDNSFSSYLFVPILYSQAGLTGMYIGPPGNFGETGIGLQNGTLPTVDPVAVYDYFGPVFWNGTGNTLTFTVDQTYTGIFGNKITVAGSVPEPANWAMLIAGFGLTGAAMRRERGGQLERRKAS